MKRGDAELASVMRKILADADEVYARVRYDSILTVDGKVEVTEEELQALQEAAGREL